MFELPIRRLWKRTLAALAVGVALVIGSIAFVADTPDSAPPDSIDDVSDGDASELLEELDEPVIDATASIHGEVLRPDGRPPDRATIRLIALDGERRDAVRTRDGSFRFSSIPPGRYAVTAGSWGTGRAAWPMVDVAAGATARIVLRLDVGSRISGRVLDPDGRPRAGHRVHVRVDAPVGRLLERMLGRPIDLGDRAVVTTDPAGRFRFEGLSPGRYDVEIKRGERRVLLVPNVNAPEHVLEVRLTDAPEAEPEEVFDAPVAGPDDAEPVLVTGRVVDADGNPTPGALVRLGPMVVAVRADGTFRLETTAPERVWLETRAVGWAARLDGPFATAPGSHVALPDIVVSRIGLEIRGRVESSRGEPIAGARVTARFERPDGGVERIAVGTDVDGAYQIDGPDFASHAVQLSVRAVGRRSATRVVHPDPLSTSSFRLVQSAEIVGVATFSGPIPTALEGSVRAPDGSWRPERCAWDAHTGRFRLLGLAPGRCAFRLTADGYAPSVGPTVDLAPNAVVALPIAVALLRGGTIVGRVTDPSGEPIVGAEVVVAAGVAGRTDADGAFYLENVPAGRVTLYIHAGPRDVDSPSFEAEVREGETTRVDGRVPH